jgi:hypothetical protein
MKQQDIERLKKICEKEGFELSYEIDVHNPIFFKITKKDPWDRVEFAECINNRNSCAYTNGKIYPIVSIVDNYVNTLFDDEFYPKNGRHKDFIRPSTEAAYVEQLKEKAKELYGDIKEGDEFDRTSINPRWGVVKMEMSEKRGLDYFNYDKANDTLYFGKYAIYSKGQWAKKIERVRVNLFSFRHEGDYANFVFNVSKNACFKSGITDYLAKCLEDKLNEI